MASSSSSCSSTVAPTRLILLLLTITALATQSTAGFTCSGTSPRATCHALVDYVSPNATTLSAIKKLFNVKKLNDLLGANNLEIAENHGNTAVAASQRIRIPFPCACANGTGISNRTPVYVVKPGDGLDHIARDIFGAIVTYQDIAAVNGIPNPDLIEKGQELRIPIPCSCDAVDGADVVHYAHVVESGSSVQAIAASYGTTEATLLRLNRMANASELLAGQLFDVPLRACSSSVRNDSLDAPLLVPNATYAITAHQCIKCKCDSANNFTLQCEPSQLKPEKWSTCPLTQCIGTNLSIGNMTTSGTCGGTGNTCAYAGYDNQTIFTALTFQSTCPATNNGTNGNGAIKMNVQAWNWNLIFISFHLFIITFALF